MNINLKDLDAYLSQVRYASVIFSPQQKICYTNPIFESLFASSTDLNNHSSLQKIFSHQPLLVKKVEEVYHTGKTFYLRDVEMIFESSKKMFNIEIFALGSVADEPFGVVLNFFDIFDDWLFVEQKKRSDNISHLNLIASGLAHEIKNPLAGMRGAAQFIKNQTQQQDSLQKYSEIIIKEADRINRLVQHLLQLTRPKILQLESVNLNKILHDIRILVSSSLLKKITFVEEYDTSLPSISGDGDLLRQVFLNLINNAIDAIENSGTIKISSQIVVGAVFLKENQKRKIVRIIIQDSGLGITADSIQKIFTPFYSTKKQGNGLGLSIVHELIELHHGSIKVKSETGKGTVFEVYLPI